ncbi:bifunctional glutamate N-acetyltransferase/amino-acid acetyltransferase ArgJ [Asticcacaulis sp. ZE23SCel15]|uniref:bifunctional glutamate N-acetyltransferase/amino-acid acetyltransferase ArgJ n=1 Tax=Asticcacaulis sp. ZE23SCel15 TaxID=3059027 RepID=UPI00265E3608|nr:bifunctional glutamate N-acetyltransferase/amino-acid acetyltransferase ArgJ [Asticcacaulis sp. ZE23SCel15]WKL57406.1 bifunctional glutamate N-acetyltransferase/amino-acid acetyltransferase ArgJ [Asticcacaulis sp. ZE23SCel15]
MTKTPTSGASSSSPSSGLERALDPLANALKRAVQTGAEMAGLGGTATTEPVKPATGKPGLEVSPLMQPLPVMPVVAGVEIAIASAGFYKHVRPDLLVMKFIEGTTAAGVFTRHTIGSAPVDWCKKQLAANEGSDIRALVVNAGCANAFTGKLGADAARRTAAAVSRRLDCRQRDIMLASTGVIGQVLDDAKIAAKLPEIDAGFKADAWHQAAQAIMTTDTFPKGAYEFAEIDGVEVRIAGIAKGSGMIAPDMATMLAFIVTDANLSAGVLQSLLGLYTRTTFNCVTVDGDTSTNDTALLFATGASRSPKISRAGDRRLADFRVKLEKVMHNLAIQLVRDGEGARKLVKINVTGASSPASARKIAKSIAESPLVKTAFAGEDANWGRIVMAVGKTEEEVDRDRISIKFGDLVAAENGAVSLGYDEAAMSAYMKNAELEVSVDVGVGRGAAHVYTCDLTHGYISINGDYRS